MEFELFGYKLGKNKKEESRPSGDVLVPDSYDGSYILETGGVFGTFVDFSGAIRDENQSIQQYRAMALYPEVDTAIEDIITEAIVLDQDRKPIKLNLDRVNLSESIKTKIHSEFNYILRLMDFSNRGPDIFRRWYIDSKLFYYKRIDKNDIRKGIVELVPIDPIKIKKIKKIEKDKAVWGGSAPFAPVKRIEEYYLYTDTDKESQYPTSSSGWKIASDAVAYTHSGIIDATTKRVVGYLQKAVRPLNLLRQIEDAVAIYRISRAPERRIFYVDVGNLPKQKAEQYLREIMNRYRNKITFDSATGQIRDSRNHMHMLEDYWMPRREGGRGTEITTLDGGQNLGQMEDVLYLQQKLYRALGVPLSRMMPDTGFNMGRSAEITRDEVKFGKFIDALRQRFSTLFTDILKTQVLLKGLMSEEDWNRISQDIAFTFNQDSYFTELKRNDILRERLDIIAAVTPFIGKFFSEEYVRKHFLMQPEEEILEINAQINREQLQQLQAQEAQMYQQMMSGGGPEEGQEETEEQPEQEGQQ
jgi:hypothetical protein